MNNTQELLNYQKYTLQKIISKFKKENIVILNDKIGVGKSTIVDSLCLDDYQTHIFRGTYDKMQEEFGVFKGTFFRANDIKSNFVKDSMKSAVTSVANLLNISADYSDTIDAMFNKYSHSDFIKLTSSLKQHVIEKKALFIFDELMYYDSASMMIMNYLLDLNTTLEQNLFKILVVIDDETTIDELYLKKFSNAEKVQCYPITPVDMTTLHLSHQPTSIILRKKNGLLEASVVSDIIDELIKVLNKNVEQKIVLQTLKLFDEPLEISQLAASIPEYSFDEIEFNLNNLYDKGLILSYNSISGRRIISLNTDISKKLEELTPIYIKENRSDIYLNYLNKNRPQNYFEKFQHYKINKDVENILINGTLAYCNFMRESITLNSKRITELIEFIKSNLDKEYIKVIQSAYNEYIFENYENTYNIINNYLSLNQNYFNVNEIQAELMYLKFLSLGRIENGKDLITEDSIDTLEKIINHMDKIRNVELETRLKEVQIFSYDLLNPTRFKKKIAQLYFSVLDEYSLKIRNDTHNRKFWQIRHAILGSKIDIIDLPHNKLVLLQQSYEVLTQFKHLYPKQYLRTACNLSGRYFWEANYIKSNKILTTAKSFIKTNKVSEHWGIIFHVSLVVNFLDNQDINLILRESDKLLFNQEIEKRMHEPDIYSSNHAVFLACKGNIDDAITLINKRLSLHKSNNYSKYLLLTNKQVLLYFQENKSHALSIHKEIQKIVCEGIPNFDHVFIKKREEAILQLIQQNKKISDFRLYLREPAAKGAMRNSSDAYFRYLLVSNITYWVN
ncbi:hypothetical protein [Holzapfeliella floricola]|uniref:hypothetical protein n=1 Tax=Holzapfeliella floricola TaxID=679249 RepID=UPI000705405E|nr:hypothetical protein [Holzapfeliella floricola]